MPIVGSCNRCGRCCEEGGRFEYTFVEDENGEQRITFARFNPSSEGVKRCMKLSYDPDSGLAVCGKQEDKSSPVFEGENMHLVICRLYPQVKEELVFPECGYRWED